MSGIDLIGGRRSSRIGRTTLCGTAAIALLASTGCATLGGNVSGDFACRAPDGTCAPMSAIDARAVQTMVGEADAGDRGIATGAKQAFRSQSVSGPVGRTGERTLRVVFPAHVDRAGVLHDEATAHVVVEDPAWTVTPADPATRTPVGTSGVASSFEISRSPAPSSLREVIAGASAPVIEGLESLPAQAPHPIMGIDVPRVPGIVPRPTPEALAAARTGRRIVRPKAIDLSKVPLDRSLTLPVIEGTTPRPMPTTGKPAAGIAGAIAAGRVRALAKPAIEKLGQSPGEPDLDGVFAPATVPKDAPR
jgi:conjugal transfer pilus assembly protein TraV